MAAYWLKVTLGLLGCLSVWACTPNLMPERSLEFNHAIVLDDIPLQVAIFDTPQERAMGLMQVRHLAPDTGALFVFEQETATRFWMKNTQIYLDLLFFNAAGQLISHVEKAPPCQTNCEEYEAVGVKYVLELSAGFFSQHQLTPTSRLKLEYFY